MFSLVRLGLRNAYFERPIFVADAPDVCLSYVLPAGSPMAWSPRWTPAFLIARLQSQHSILRYRLGLDRPTSLGHDRHHDCRLDRLTVRPVHVTTLPETPLSIKTGTVRHCLRSLTF
ncbi:hypothetical protein MRX96_015428 [Rhipicephalus microplus]